MAALYFSVAFLSFALPLLPYPCFAFSRHFLSMPPRVFPQHRCRIASRSYPCNAIARQIYSTQILFLSSPCNACSAHRSASHLLSNPFHAIPWLFRAHPVHPVSTQPHSCAPRLAASLFQCFPNPSNTIAVGSNSLPSLVISFPSQCISANASLGNSSASQPFAAAGTRRFSSHFFSSMVYTT